MKFYRRLTKIKAISFDLDDTLYSNRPVMLAINKKMIAYFAQLPVLKNTISHQQLTRYEQGLGARFWFQFRTQAISKQPNLVHDVVQVRLVSYRLGLLALGLDIDTAEQEAQAALNYFIKLRSDFTVPKASHDLLTVLSNKYPLVAISNGNVDTKTLGIDHYFQHIYHAGDQTDGSLLKQKPESDMFDKACAQLAIKPVELLHVGDCGRADIQGALMAGCQAAWLSYYDVGKPITVLPHIELTSLCQLQLL